MDIKRTDVKEDDDELNSNNFINFKNAKVMFPYDCSDDMLNFAIVLAIRSKESYDIDNNGVDIAKYLKEEMDKKYEPFWHVVCGRNFGCYAIHQSRNFIFFYLDNVGYMLYKS